MRVGFLGVAGALPGAGSANVSLVVQSGGGGRAHTVLVDCSGTPAAALGLLGLPADKVDTVVLTHTHTDHFYALPSLIHAQLMVGRTRALNLVATPETLERAFALLDVFGLFKRAAAFGLRTLEVTDGRRIEPDGSLGLGLSPFRVEHSVPTVGLLFEEAGNRLCYSCDTRPCDSLRAAAEGCTVLIHEASGIAAEEESLNLAGHSTAQQAARAAAVARAQSLFLVHAPAVVLEDHTDGGTRRAYLEEARRAFSGTVSIPDVGRWYDV